ncbi:MAG: T9SS type A sorting domain-containing protein, partial [Chitinophagales bacterium]
GFDNSIIEVYPNPAFDIIYLKSNGDLINSVKLYNSEGQFINDWFNNTKEMIIDLEILPTGVYLLKINTETNYSISKIIKL